VDGLAYVQSYGRMNVERETDFYLVDLVEGQPNNSKKATGTNTKHKTV